MIRINVLIHSFRVKYNIKNKTTIQLNRKYYKHFF